MRDMSVSLTSCAPANFGKTTILVNWVHQNKIPVAWFYVDKGDNDSLHFLTYVILRLQGLEVGTGKCEIIFYFKEYYCEYSKTVIILENYCRY